MVAGHLQEKNGYYYIVISFYNDDGKRETRWKSTGLQVKGNKKRAEAMLSEERKNFKCEHVDVGSDMYFADYLEYWLKVIKPSIQTTTYAGYAQIVNSVVTPYFRDTKTLLNELKAKEIQDFYADELEKVSASTVIHYHCVIHKALKYAVKTDMLSINPADKIERPKREKFVGSFYDSDEMSELFEKVRGDKLELPVLFGAFYGLRRSEVLGLKWDTIDFLNNTITIRHTVTECNINGKLVKVAHDTTKTKSSMRSLPLVAAFKSKLEALKEEQASYRKLCGRSYCNDYDGYICVDEMGNLIKPNFITTAFPKFLEKNNMRVIRFHDGSVIIGLNQNP